MEELKTIVEKKIGIYNNLLNIAEITNKHEEVEYYNKIIKKLIKIYKILRD